MGYGNDWNVYFRGSDDMGATWSPIVRADDDTTGGASYSPNISGFPGSPVIAMQDSRPGYGAYHTWVALGRSGNSGIPGGAPPEAAELRISPNPSPSGAEIRWSIPGAREGLMRVFDAGGRLVLGRAVAAGGDLRLTLPSGVYVVRVESGGRSANGKLVRLP